MAGDIKLPSALKNFLGLGKNSVKPSTTPQPSGLGRRNSMSASGVSGLSPRTSVPSRSASVSSGSSSASGSAPTSPGANLSRTNSESDFSTASTAASTEGGTFLIPRKPLSESAEINAANAGSLAKAESQSSSIAGNLGSTAAGGMLNTKPRAQAIATPQTSTLPIDSGLSGPVKEMPVETGGSSKVMPRTSASAGDIGSHVESGSPPQTTSRTASTAGDLMFTASRNAPKPAKNDSPDIHSDLARDLAGIVPKTQTKDMPHSTLLAGDLETRPSSGNKPDGDNIDDNIAKMNKSADDNMRLQMASQEIQTRQAAISAMNEMNKSLIETTKAAAKDVSDAGEKPS
jgi:hypothetical protein